MNNLCYHGNNITDSIEAVEPTGPDQVAMEFFSVPWHRCIGVACEGINLYLFRMYVYGEPNLFIISILIINITVLYQNMHTYIQYKMSCIYI